MISFILIGAGLLFGKLQINYLQYITSVKIILPICFYIIGIILFFIAKKRCSSLIVDMPLERLKKINKVNKYTFWVVFVIYFILSFTHLHYNITKFDFRTTDAVCFDMITTVLANFMFPFIFGFMFLITRCCIKEREKQ